MTSILKVDQLQDSGGNAILTSDGAGSITTASGLNTAITNAGFVTSANAGKVLQVVQATDETARSTTSGTYVTASNTLSVSITPSSTSNKILILTNTSTYQSSADSTMNAAIFKNASQLKYISYNFQRTDNSNVINAIYLDSPATTSSITYDIRFSIGTGTAYINASGSIGTIVAMEISA